MGQLPGLPPGTPSSSDFPLPQAEEGLLCPPLDGLRRLPPLPKMGRWSPDAIFSGGQHTLEKDLGGGPFQMNSSLCGECPPPQTPTAFGMGHWAGHTYVSPRGASPISPSSCTPRVAPLLRGKIGVGQPDLPPPTSLRGSPSSSSPGHADPPRFKVTHKARIFTLLSKPWFSYARACVLSEGWLAWGVLGASSPALGPGLPSHSCPAHGAPSPELFLASGCLAPSPCAAACLAGSCQPCRGGPQAGGVKALLGHSTGAADPRQERHQLLRHLTVPGGGGRGRGRS